MCEKCHVSSHTSSMIVKIVEGFRTRKSKTPDLQAILRGISTVHSVVSNALREALESNGSAALYSIFFPSTDIHLVRQYKLKRAEAKPVEGASCAHIRMLTRVERAHVTWLSLRVHRVYPLHQPQRLAGSDEFLGRHVALRSFTKDPWRVQPSRISRILAGTQLGLLGVREKPLA